jgi:hypothetical protein
LLTIISAPTCDSKGIAAFFDLDRDVIISREDRIGKKWEFQIGCSTRLQEPTFNVINCWPEQNGKSDEQGFYFINIILFNLVILT